MWLWDVDLLSSVPSVYKQGLLHLSVSELIYKEVMNYEERLKNGVVKGQPSPSGTLSA